MRGRHFNVQQGAETGASTRGSWSFQALVIHRRGNLETPSQRSRSALSGSTRNTVENEPARSTGTASGTRSARARQCHPAAWAVAARTSRHDTAVKGPKLRDMTSSVPVRKYLSVTVHPHARPENPVERYGSDSTLLPAKKQFC